MKEKWYFKVFWNDTVVYISYENIIKYECRNYKGNFPILKILSFVVLILTTKCPLTDADVKSFLELTAKFVIDIHLLCDRDKICVRNETKRIAIKHLLQSTISQNIHKTSINRRRRLRDKWRRLRDMLYDRNL